MGTWEEAIRKRTLEQAKLGLNPSSVMHQLGDLG